MKFNQREDLLLQIIHERNLRYKLEDQITELKQEIVVLRRLLLEAITSILHHRHPNDEFMRIINRTLRLEKLPEDIIRKNHSPQD